MDIFVCPQAGNGYNLSSAKLINNYTRATWVERFTKASEFVIEAPLDSTVREEMPIGSLVSHINSEQVCIVEDHEIVIDQDSDISDMIRVTGRGFETFLENRIIGSNKVWPQIAPTEDPPYSIPHTWAVSQARKLITDHIDWQTLVDDNDWLPGVNVWLSPWINGTWGTLQQPDEAIFERVPVYGEALKLLGLDNLGMGTFRPREGLNLDDGRDSPTRYDPNGLTICLYPGRDMTKRVTFSHTTGDIKKANYLFSSRLHKTSCLVHSRYYAVMVHGPEAGMNRKVMVLEAKDLDEQYDTVPGFAIGDKIRAAMVNRGRAALAGQKPVAMSNVEVDDADFTYVFRKDYYLGDYVSVHGDYQASTTLQVTENVEIQDENGYTSYPTLSEPPSGGYYVPAQHVP